MNKTSKCDDVEIPRNARGLNGDPIHSLLQHQDRDHFRALKSLFWVASFLPIVKVSDVHP